MRATIIAAASLLAFATAASAQSPEAQSPARTQQNQSGGATAVRSVNVIDISELPEDTQKKVNAVAAKASKQDLEKLRGSIDASPEIKGALTAKGVTSAQVIVANLDSKGALTLVTKKSG